MESEHDQVGDFDRCEKREKGQKPYNLSVPYIYMQLLAWTHIACPPTQCHRN